MPAVSTMILRSMRLIGEKERGGTLTTDEAVECLDELNTAMESWSINRLLCYQVLQESFPLAANTVSYTIGTGATFSTARPTKIVDPCFVRDSSNLDSPLTLIEAESYGAIVQKNVGQAYPTWLFYDHAFDSSGYATINVYPAPISNLTLFINSWKQLQSFANVSTQLLLPPGYRLFIESNFALHLAGGVRNVSPEVAKMARDSMAAVKSINLPQPVASLDAGIVRGTRMNIITGP